jgi:alpha-tubulin suppressor-like RCC1 family protein
MSWGANFSGQLGDSTGRTRKLPVLVEFPLPDVFIVAIDASVDSSFALDSVGRLWSWGDNAAYQLGDTASSLRSAPLYLGGLEQQGKVRSFAAGPAGAAAVLADGSLWVWGFYRQYEEPTRVTTLPGSCAQVRLGESHLVVTLTDGRLLTSGDNAYGQLGDGSVTSPADLVFVPPSGVTGPVTLFTTGYYHTLAMDAKGRLMGWGDNAVGQLGNGVRISQSVPIGVRTLGAVTHIASGNYHALALLDDGTVRAWGYNSDGQLGDKSDVPVRTGPVAVQGLTGIRRVAAGGSSSAALDASGRLWTWGANLRGQLTLPEGVYRSNAPALASGMPPLIDVSVGSEHMLGLDLQGRVWVWGANGYGQLGDGYNQATSPRVLTSLTNIMAVSASGDHSMALDSQGRVWAWGDNGYQQVGPSVEQQVKIPIQITGLPPIKAIAAGYYSSLALGQDGSLWAWGEGGEGQLGDGKLESRGEPARAGNELFAAIGAGALHALATRADGTVLAFGASYFGQIGDGALAQRNVPVLVVNPGSDGFLNVSGEGSPRIPPALNVPFFAAASGGVSDTLATVANTINFKSADRGKPGAVFVTARVPVGTLGSSGVTAGASGGKISTRAVRSSQPAAAGTSGFVLVQLTPLGWQTVVNGQLIPYANGVIGDQMAAQTILDKTDTSLLKGANFCVGYGSTAQDMVSNGNMRTVATIPGATADGSCEVGGSISTELKLAPGWNLLGNPVNQTIAVADKFGDASRVTSVWKWDSATAKWQFYAPGLSATALQSYVAEQGYQVLADIHPGDGYWVNATAQANLGVVSGSSVYLRQSSLVSGWNLVSTASPFSARDFNASLSSTPPTAGQVPVNMTSMWAWDTALSNWYFYAPSLDAAGSSQLTDYANSKGYQDFMSTGKTLGNGTGFWVNRP